MKRLWISLALLTPSVAMAHGDVGLVWWVLGGFATYLLVGALLVLYAVRKEVHPLRLGLFALATAALWYVYLNSSSSGVPVHLFFMVLAPLLFLIRWPPTRKD